MIKEYNTIYDMQHETSPLVLVPNQLAYVKGYFTAGDGGGGMFIYNAASVEQENLGTIFYRIDAHGNPGTEGRWYRQYEGYMNVEYFGVQKAWDFYTTTDPLFSNSDRIQIMIDFATSKRTGHGDSKSNDVTIFFPNGDYFIDKPLILKDEITLLGSSGTQLTNEKYNYDYMFKLDEGPVSKLRVENFIINVNKQFHFFDKNNPENNIGVGGFEFKAQFGRDENEKLTPGGLWEAVFRNIIILNVKGIGMLFQGGDDMAATYPVSDNPEDGMFTDYHLPNQFIVFDNVRIIKELQKFPAIKLSGQNANYDFLNCEFRNAEDHDCYGGTIIDISSVNGDKTPKIGSNAISFIDSGFGGYAELGVKIRDAGNISFDTCFCEGLDTCFDIKRSRQVQILNSRFPNAAGCGDLGSYYSSTGNKGRIVIAEDSIVNVWNNFVLTGKEDYAALPDQYFIESYGNNNVINAQNNTFSPPALGKTYGIHQIVNVDYDPSTSGTTDGTGTIHISSKKLVFVTVPESPASTVSRIDSEICAGEAIFIRANLGPIKFVPMDVLNELDGRNIHLNGRLSLQIENGQAATFIKIDNIIGNETASYQLVSIAD